MRTTNLILSVLALSMISLTYGQRRKNAAPEPQPAQIAHQPKLVVGIVVDQMRYDYLTRFWNQYGEGGFKRLVNEGFNCKNNHFN